MKRDGDRRSVGGSAGSILLEVVVAAALVGLIVGPLAVTFSNMVERARAERQVAAAVGTAAGNSSAKAGASAGDPVGPPWEWGTRVLGAQWRPGPVLHVTLGADGSGALAGGTVGLWVDGWQVAQVSVGSDGDGAVEATVDGRTWSGLAGHELVIRARETGGIWGAPWRLALPAANGADPQAGSADPGAAVDPMLVLHRPCVGTSTPRVSWSVAPLALPAFPLLFAVREPDLAGWSGVTIDGRSQWWWAEEGRSVDVYF